VRHLPNDLAEQLIGVDRAPLIGQRDHTSTGAGSGDPEIKGVISRSTGGSWSNDPGHARMGAMGFRRCPAGA
jgi:hypothetical protein